MRRGTVRFDAGTCIDSNFAVISVTVAIAVRTSATDIKASILILLFPRLAMKDLAVMATGCTCCCCLRDGS
jgi:hypothetical protein